MAPELLAIIGLARNLITPHPRITARHGQALITHAVQDMGDC